MNIKRKHAIVIGCLALLALALATVAAQEIASPLLTLTSPDPAHPAQFQLIAPGDAPLTAGFTSRLDLTAPQEETAWNVVYVAIENTGWSAGTLGLVSDALDHAGWYVALEIGADGTPIEGGLAFALTFDATLGANGGFTLPVLIDKAHRFGIFPIGMDGQLFAAHTPAYDQDNTVKLFPVDFFMETASPAIFPSLVLEFHIMPLQGLGPTPVPSLRTASTRTPWPLVTNTLAIPPNTRTPTPTLPPAPLLTFISPDPAHPVQFQLIAPGDAPLTAGFTSRLDLTAPQEETTWNIVYVAIENTGWSEGTIGLISNALDPDGQYVALEVDLDGHPVAGGLAFDLIFDATLGANGGFTLPVLISRTRRFGIFPAGGEDGAPFAAQTNVRATDGTVSQLAADLQLDAASETILAPLVLEVHIIARAIPTATPRFSAAPPASGSWGACGSCTTCDRPGECILSPDGQCFWNPGGCAGVGPAAPVTPGGAPAGPVWVTLTPIFYTPTVTAAPPPTRTP